MFIVPTLDLDIRRQVAVFAIAYIPNKALLRSLSSPPNMRLCVLSACACACACACAHARARAVAVFAAAVEPGADVVVVSRRGAGRNAR